MGWARGLKNCYNAVERIFCGADKPAQKLISRCASASLSFGATFRSSGA